MKCNKCGTPIIPGEDNCRICGNKNDFSERTKEVELIDFPDDIKGVSMDLPDLDAIIDTKEEIVEPTLELVNEIEMPTIEETQVTEEAPVVLEDVVEPALEPVVEPVEVNEVEEPKVVEKVEEKVEPKIEEVVEETKPSKKQVLDKANEKVEKPKKVKKEKQEKKSSGGFVIVLVILLLASLALNAYLFVMDGNAKANEKGNEPKNEQVYSKVSYGSYRVTIPSTWIIENGSNGLLVYDDTQNWSFNMQMVNDADYETFVTNKENLVDSLVNLKYQFTSNYSKEVEEKEYHIFKGKYYDYSVYVIATELSEDSIVFVDLKFKGEVDDILLNSVLESMSNVKTNDTTELFKDNFEFQNISNEIKMASQKIEE